MAKAQTLNRMITGLSRAQMKQGLALLGLLVLFAFAVAGPTGLLAWNENATALTERNAQIAMLTEQRDELEHRVQLLDYRGADPDLAGELVRGLNVVHPDEVVITLED
jgi:cell division protein FtsB